MYNIKAKPFTMHHYIKLPSQSTRPDLSLLLTVVVLLHSFAMVSQSWYIIGVDINKCLYCGQMIVSFGDILEKHYAYRLLDAKKYRETNDFTHPRKLSGVSKTPKKYHAEIHDTSHIMDVDKSEPLGTSNAGTTKEIKPTENDMNTTALVQRRHPTGSDEVTLVNNNIFVYIGLLTTSVCNEYSSCVSLSSDDAGKVVRSIIALNAIQETVCMLRICCALSLGMSCLTLVMHSMDQRANKTEFYSLTIAAGLSAGTSLVAVALSSTTLLHVVSSSDAITLHIPWAMFSYLIGFYLLLLIIYNRQDSEDVLNPHGLHYWHNHRLKVV